MDDARETIVKWTEGAAVRSLDRDGSAGQNSCYAAQVQSKRDWGRGGELGNAARRRGDVAALWGSGEHGVGMRGGGGGSGKYPMRLKQMNVHRQLDTGCEHLRPECIGNKFATPRH
jgi:hypothetical protein